MPKRTGTTPSRDCPPQSGHAPLVVGLGASAGGLEALQTFFGQVPTASGLIFVIVQHLDPASEDLLPRLLSRHTALPFVAIADGLPAQPDHIYVAPSHGAVELRNGHFQCQATEQKPERRMPIDVFFHSLAENPHIHAVGVILSGAGTDGLLGLKSISEAGGMTMAQAPETARYDSMPRHAISMGVVDHVLPPEKMPAELLAYAQHLRQLAEPGNPQQEQQQRIAEAIPEIADILSKETGHNFQHYKISTLTRRIQRRLQVLRLGSVQDYVNQLRQEPREAHTLFRELLIGVTAFFRDPEAFAALETEVLPRLFENRGAGETLRLWVVGCATGEEAYSLAMLVREQLDRREHPPEVQIFATDIDERALTIARQGSYPLSAAEDLSRERLKRFFIKKGQRLQVTKEIRDLCLFSAHNLISDSPFSRLDLISCRNVLIYLGPHLQKKLIPVFHYALRPNGYLFLGPSEQIAAHTELFRPINAKLRISQRKSTSIRPSAILDAAETYHANNKTPGQVIPAPDIYQVMQRIVLDEFAPKSVVVNEEGQILCTSGNVSPFLEVTAGRFQNNITKLIQSGLRLNVRSALNEAIQTARKVVQENIAVRLAEGLRRLTLIVQPMPRLGEGSELFLIVFQDLGPVVLPEEEPRHTVTDQTASLVEQLERELSSTREDLEKTIQELESTNEELKSSNEELLSMNEELQSANEELETSKEEIQTSNDALGRSNNDLENLLRSTQIATIFLDPQGHILRFTPAVTAIYNLIPGDVGRPLSDITHRADVMPPLPTEKQLRTAAALIEHEVNTQENQWYLRRVLPYRTSRDEYQGMVVTFIDITDRKLADLRLSTEHVVTRLLAEAASFEEAGLSILDALRRCLRADTCHLWLLDERTRQLHCAGVQTDKRAVHQKPFLEKTLSLRLARGQGLPGMIWDRQQPLWLRDLDNEPDLVRSSAAQAAGLHSAAGFPILVGDDFFGVIEFFLTEELPRSPALLSMMTAIGSEIGQFIQRTHAERQLRESEERLRSALEAAHIGTWRVDVQTQQETRDANLNRILGLAAEVTTQPIEQFFACLHPDDRDNAWQGYQTALHQSDHYQCEVRIVRPDGAVRWIRNRGRVIAGPAGQPLCMTGAVIDITEARQTHETLARLAAIIETTTDLVATKDTEGRIIYLNPAGRQMLGLDSLEDLSRYSFSEFYTPEAAQQIQHEAFPAARERGTWSGETILRRRDGRTIPVSKVLIAHKTESGAVEFYSTVERDISERVRIQQSLLEARHSADTANQSKSEFLANMSHEIRTPMTAILGYADVLAAHLADPDNLECVETIRRNGRFLLEIINDILDLSKIEAGKMTLDRMRFAIDELVAEVHSLMQVRALEKKIPLLVEFTGDIPQTIESDPIRLRQILVNLVGNAIKFTDTGSVRLLVQFVPSAARPLLRFDVIDTGIGMSQEQQKRLFQPFTQADASVTRKYGGTGLGLTICKRLVEMLGGTISLESAAGLGSRFTVTVPTGTLDGVPLVQPRSEIIMPSQAALPPRKLHCRVLVVDDRREVRYLAQHFIEEAGGIVQTAGNGAEAIAVIEKAAAAGHPFDLVVMDMQMPVLDGYQTIARLRANNFQAPILALTAAAMQGDRDRCLRAGCDDYLSKPIEGYRLVDLVAHYTQDYTLDELAVRRKQRQRETAAAAPAADAAAMNNGALRILLVDDGEDACRALSILLKMSGHEVRSAFTGRQALETIQQFTPDVVLLDIGLPDMDGYQVLQQLQQQDRLGHTAFIALSGRGEPEDQERSRQAGFWHHLIKPVEYPDLEALLLSRK